MTNRECVIAQMEVMINIAIRDIENPLNHAFGPFKSSVIDELKAMRRSLPDLNEETLLYKIAPDLRQLITYAWNGLDRKVA